MEHTQGKWIIVASKKWLGQLFVKREGTNDDFVCKVYGPQDGTYNDKVNANARLIAAAPDLLEALKQTLKTLQSFYLERLVCAGGKEDEKIRYCQENIKQTIAQIEKGK
ncbi:MAG: hypothetical protein KAS32_10635 [Candidatus Peribacteraceae bacterium]|nr:hypothetical protein [Candidatus Peribacteraceae bacterium]